MASYVTPKRGSAFIMSVGLPDYATAGRLKSAPTIAAGDFKVSKDGGAFANMTNLPTAVGVEVILSFTGTEMTADNLTVACIDQTATPEWCDVIINIQTSARQIDDLAFPNTSGRGMVVDANGLVDANMVKVGPTGSGTAQTAGDIMADTNDIQTRLPAALVSGRMDVSVGAMAADVMTAAAAAADLKTELQAGLSTLDAAGVRTAVGLASANLDTQLTAIDDYLDTEVAAIKAKTDSLTFTVAGQVDANVQRVNDVTVVGTGASGDEWGPA